MRLSGSVKFFCALGSGSSDGGAAGLPGFLRPSACRRFLGLRFGLGRRGRFRLGLQFGLRRPDLLDALLLVGDPFWQLLAALVAAEALSSSASAASAALGRRWTSASSSAARFSMRS